MQTSIIQDFVVHSKDYECRLQVPVCFRNVPGTYSTIPVANESPLNVALVPSVRLK
jgi:hypothetical protein